MDKKIIRSLVITLIGSAASFFIVRYLTSKYNQG